MEIQFSEEPISFTYMHKLFQKQNVDIDYNNLLKGLIDDKLINDIRTIGEKGLEYGVSMRETDSGKWPVYDINCQRYVLSRLDAYREAYGKQLRLGELAASIAEKDQDVTEQLLKEGLRFDGILTKNPKKVGRYGKKHGVFKGQYGYPIFSEKAQKYVRGRIELYKEKFPEYTATSIKRNFDIKVDECKDQSLFTPFDIGEYVILSIDYTETKDVTDLTLSNLGGRVLYWNKFITDEETQVSLNRNNANQQENHESGIELYEVWDHIKAIISRNLH